MAAYDNPPSSLGDGRKQVTAAGTAEALSDTSVECAWVIVSPLSDNTSAEVVVGASTVVFSVATRRGTPVAAEGAVVVPCDNLQDVFVDVGTDGDGVSFTYGVV